MTDLRELLRELLEVWINGRKIHDGMPLPLRERIDAALAQQPESVAGVAIVTRKDLDELAKSLGNLSRLPTKSELIKLGKAWAATLSDCAAPPSAGALIAEKDAEIERLKAVIQRYVEAVDHADRRVEAAELRAKTYGQKFNDQCKNTDRAIHDRIAAERALAGAKAQTLLEGARAVEALKQPCGMDPESRTASLNGKLMDASYLLRKMASEHERGG